VKHRQWHRQIWEEIQRKKPIKLTLASSNTCMKNYLGEYENGDTTENLPLYFGCQSRDRNSTATKRNWLRTEVRFQDTMFTMILRRVIN
jgi:hypothetical protein